MELFLIDVLVKLINLEDVIFVKILPQELLNMLITDFGRSNV